MLLSFALAFAVATADRWTTLLFLFLGQALSWAGIPAVGAAVAGAAGVLASQGTLHLSSVLIIGTAGAEVGGIIGWRLGRWASARPGKRDGRFSERSAKALASGHRLEEKVGGVMVFFVPSWVSGSLGMTLRRFALWNLAAAALWTLAAVLGAYGIGSAISGGHVKDWLIPGLIAVAAIGALIYAFVRWRRHVARAAASELSAST